MRIILFSIFVLLTSCGKNSELPPTLPVFIGREIDPISEGNFSEDEKILGNNFCNSLSYKRTNFLNLYSDPLKRFHFFVKNRTCGASEEISSSQILGYKASNPLSYLSLTTSTIIPKVETESNGSFSIYCANRNRNSRVFSSGKILSVFHFLTGKECGGEENDLCAVVESTSSDNLTTTFKKILISSGTYLGLDLRGQEIDSFEQSLCDDGNIQSTSFQLSKVTDI
jgi:hypothetical protein